VSRELQPLSHLFSPDIVNAGIQNIIELFQVLNKLSRVACLSCSLPVQMAFVTVLLGTLLSPSRSHIVILIRRLAMVYIVMLSVEKRQCGSKDVNETLGPESETRPRHLAFYPRRGRDETLQKFSETETRPRPLI
jgi:hypothetical protein